MIDITKEEFLKNNYIEIEKVSKKKNKIKEIISKNRILLIVSTAYVIIITINLYLINYFFKLFSKL